MNTCDFIPPRASMGHGVFMGAGERVIPDHTSDWKTAPADVSAAGPGDGSVWLDPVEERDRLRDIIRNIQKHYGDSTEFLSPEDAALVWAIEQEEP